MDSFFGFTKKAAQGVVKAAQQVSQSIPHSKQAGATSGVSDSDVVVVPTQDTNPTGPLQNPTCSQLNAVSSTASPPLALTDGGGRALQPTSSGRVVDSVKSSLTSFVKNAKHKGQRYDEKGCVGHLTLLCSLLPFALRV